jgi:CheY-like chemotaxis protein
MPGVTGHDVLHGIKSTLELKRLPVVIFTSSTEAADLERSYDNGANSYLVKPVSYQGFLKVMRQVHDYWLSLNLAPPAPQV